MGDRTADVHNCLVVKHLSVDDKRGRLETYVRIDGVFEDHIALNLASQFQISFLVRSVSFQER